MNIAYSMLGIIKRNVFYLFPHTFTTLYKAIVRSHLEYASTVWKLHYENQIKSIEKLHVKAMKLVITVKHLPYAERLKALQLPTFTYRRFRGHMTEVYKILTGKYSKTSL